MSEDSEDFMVEDDQTQSSGDHDASGPAMALSHPPFVSGTLTLLKTLNFQAPGLPRYPGRNAFWLAPQLANDLRIHVASR